MHHEARRGESQRRVHEALLDGVDAVPKENHSILVALSCVVQDGLIHQAFESAIVHVHDVTRISEHLR